MARGEVLLLAGGRHEAPRGSDSVMAQALRRLGGQAPVLAYIGAASEDSIPFRHMISALLESSGAGKILPVNLCRKGASLTRVRALLENADAVFLSGGDVERGMEVLENSGISAHLRLLAAQGKPFVGLSAGSILLGRTWIRWRDPEDDASAEPFRCLGIADLICDTHDEASGWSELKALLQLLPKGSEGWGIPAGGALFIQAAGTMEWIGERPVLLRQESRSGQEEAPAGSRRR